MVMGDIRKSQWIVELFNKADYIYLVGSSPAASFTTSPKLNRNWSEATSQKTPRIFQLNLLYASWCGLLHRFHQEH